MVHQWFTLQGDQTGEGVAAASASMARRSKGEQHDITAQS